jgi:hypothetical protein
MLCVPSLRSWYRFWMQCDDGCRFYLGRRLFFYLTSGSTLVDGWVHLEKDTYTSYTM